MSIWIFPIVFNPIGLEPCPVADHHFIDDLFQFPAGGFSFLTKKRNHSFRYRRLLLLSISQKVLPKLVSQFLRFLEALCLDFLFWLRFNYFLFGNTCLLLFKRKFFLNGFSFKRNWFFTLTPREIFCKFRLFFVLFGACICFLFLFLFLASEGLRRGFYGA